MSTQHTPGPWIVGRPGGPAGPFWSLVNRDGIVIAPQVVSEVDARLIAAAPDLLVAARAVLQSPWHDAKCTGWVDDDKGSVFDRGRECTCYRAALTAAIAKAAGEQP